MTKIFLRQYMHGEYYVESATTVRGVQCLRRKSLSPGTCRWCWEGRCHPNENWAPSSAAQLVAEPFF